jgi:hypothetical protein
MLLVNVKLVILDTESKHILAIFIIRTIIKERALFFRYRWLTRNTIPKKNKYNITKMLLKII